MSVTAPVNCLQVSDLVTALQALTQTNLVVLPATNGQCQPMTDATVANLTTFTAAYRPKQSDPKRGAFQSTTSAGTPQSEGTYAVTCVGPLNPSLP